MDYMQELGSLTLGSRLKRLSDQLIAEVAFIYQEMGISLNPSFFPLLVLISKMGPQGIMQAAQKLSVSHPAISKLANKMIADGYLIKMQNPQDKRGCLLSLTDTSKLLIKQAAPIWDALKQQLDALEKQQSTPLMRAIEEFEMSLKEINLSHRVLQTLNKRDNPIEIVNWHHKYKEDFKTLNLQWINRYFDGAVTVTDQQALNYPEQYYLARGGYLFFAKQNDNVVGTLALRSTDKHSFEISKMAVSGEHQGKGIGRQLLLTALNKARQLDAQTVYLESNSQLTRAINLYQHCGFVHKAHPKGSSEYQRADVYMELQLMDNQ